MKTPPALLAFSLALAAVSLAPAAARAAERFPPPQFETEYAMPEMSPPDARSPVLDSIDAAVLVVCLALAAWFTLKKRSRSAMVWLGIFALIYFGFYREGCVCPIGATQNIALALFDASYAVPAVVAFFFFLPLIFALFFGRGFCGGVCPLGAIQDVVLLRPVRLPLWLDHSLRVLAYVYLGLAVLLATTGSAFIICRYDPFVSFFRLDGGRNMLLFGGCLLLVGVFVGRPYCRYLCPYGVLLGLASRFSRGRVAITPDKCVRCRLCEDSCPFGAIRLPTAPRAPAERRRARSRLLRAILLLPLIIAAGAWLGGELGPLLSRAHPTVQVAAVLWQEAHPAEGAAAPAVPADESLALAKARRAADEVYAEAAVVQARIGRGAWWFGAWVGLVIGAKLLYHSLLARRGDYEADRISCLACARCFDFCPQEHERRKRLVEVEV